MHSRFVSFRMQILLCVVMCRVLGCRVCSCSLPPCCCLFGFANHRRRNMRLLVGRWVDRSIPLRRYEVIVFRATSLSLCRCCLFGNDRCLVPSFIPVEDFLTIIIVAAISFCFVSFCFVSSFSSKGVLGQEQRLGERTCQRFRPLLLWYSSASLETF